MIAIKRLAIAAFAGCAAIAAAGQWAPVAFASADHADFTIAFDYDASQSAEVNYAAFRRQARLACTTPGTRTIAVRQLENACIDAAVDSFVRKIGRIDIAAIHFDRTGRRIDSSRTLAAR